MKALARLVATGLLVGLASLPAFNVPASANSSGMSTNVTIARNRDGRLEAFAVGNDSNIWHAWQVSVNGAWTDFETMPFTDVGFYHQRPSVIQNEDGRLEVFAVADGGHIWHSYQNSTGWSDWADLGGSFGFVHTAVGINKDGRLEVFAVAPDHTVRHIYQVVKNSGWSSWANLGGSLDDSMGSGLAVGHNEDGRLEVFGVSTDGALQHAWQLPNGGGWSGWATLGTGFAHDGATLAVANNADGRLEIFGVANRELVHAYQTARNGGWSSVSSMGFKAWGPGVGLNPDGRLEVFACDGMFVIHSYQLAPNGTWSPWYPLGDPQPGTILPLAVGQNQNGRLEVWISDYNDTMLSHNYYLGNGNWSGWIRL